VKAQCFDIQGVIIMASLAGGKRWQKSPWHISYTVDESPEVMVNGCKETCSIDFGDVATHW
jgi:hypothetical protein